MNAVSSENSALARLRTSAMIHRAEVGGQGQTQNYPYRATNVQCSAEKWLNEPIQLDEDVGRKETIPSRRGGGQVSTWR